jgi:hypothetical protein
LKLGKRLEDVKTKKKKEKNHALQISSTQKNQNSNQFLIEHKTKTTSFSMTTKPTTCKCF